MRNLIVKGFLKYIISLLGITIFLMGGTWMSFADKARIDSDNSLFQRSDDNGEDENEGEDDADDDEDND